jgi:hypothetical protein
MTETRDRCAFEFDSEAWAQEHDGTCFVDPNTEADRDILTENADGAVVWRCPHEVIDREDECMFHLPKDADAKPDAGTVADAFLEIANGKRESLDGDGPRPAQFIGAEFESLNLDTVKVGDGRVIDLRHSVIGSAEWRVEKVDATPLDARGVSIRNKWACDVVAFDGDALFGGAEFGGDVGFRWAEFGEDVRFSQVKFGGDTTLLKTEFGGETRFDEAEFVEGAEFGGPSSSGARNSRKSSSAGTRGSNRPSSAKRRGSMRPSSAGMYDSPRLSSAGSRCF